MSFYEGCMLSRWFDLLMDCAINNIHLYYVRFVPYVRFATLNILLISESHPMVFIHIIYLHASPTVGQSIGYYCAPYFPCQLFSRLFVNNTLQY